MSTSIAPEAIAVVGMACRLPGAENLGAYWSLLTGEQNAIAPGRGFRTGRRPGGYVDDVEYFDAALFGVHDLEATSMDPQQRLLLELTWHALEDAHRPPDSSGLGTVGVFVGCSTDDYARLVQGAGRVGDPYRMTGTARAFVANRISYVYGFTGPSLVVDTGQSSSLIALHQAVSSLRAGECETAVVAGVQLNLAPDGDQVLEDLGALSPTGQCRTFDAGADGIVRGEGGGVLVLRPLSAAQSDGDRIYCQILASATNNDGGGPGLTTPSEDAQARLLSKVYDDARLDPSTVQYVELHGTGTRAGDPVEAAALGRVLGQRRPAEQPLLVGSVKTNIGHLEAASGMASMIKVALSLHHRELVATLNHHRPSPLIDLDALGLQVCTEHRPWPTQEMTLVAGVSSFGLGGSNCHVVLGGAPPIAPGNGRSVYLPDGPLAVGISARNLSALQEQASHLADLLRSCEETDTRVIAASTLTTRARLGLRAAFVAATAHELVESLEEFGRRPGNAWASSGLSQDVLPEVHSDSEDEAVAFVLGEDSKALPFASRADLPLYPFQRQRFWFESELTVVPDPADPTGLGDLADLADLANLSSQNLSAPTGPVGVAGPGRATGPRSPLSAGADDVYGVVLEGVNLILGQDADEDFDLDLTFVDLGLDSRMVVALRNVIATAIRRTLPTTLLFDYPTPATLIVALEAADERGVA